MPSPAAIRFNGGVKRADKLLMLVGDLRLRPQTRADAVDFSHAALAALVASWDAYLNKLIDDFYAVTANPLDSKYHSMHSLARLGSERALKKFNTPNYENSRNLLIEWTGFDPLPFWVWPARSMSPLVVNQRLNEILKIRHSFAHGFSIPNFSWATSGTGKVEIKVDAVRSTKSLLNHLVSQTDKGISSFINLNYSINVNW
jgi:hypothetical protein